MPDARLQRTREVYQTTINLKPLDLPRLAVACADVNRLLSLEPQTPIDAWWLAALATPHAD